MVAISAPFGMRPVNHPSGTMRPRRMDNGIASGYATNLYKGTPVMLNTSGQIIIATAAADIIGCFWGVEFTLAGRRFPISYWPANTVPDTGPDPFYVYIFDDPRIVYEMQGAGSYAQTAVGDQADFSNIGNGTIVGGGGGFSQATLGALVGATVQGQFRIEALSPYPNNAWGDAFTVVQGKIARHQYVSNKVAI